MFQRPLIFIALCFGFNLTGGYFAKLWSVDRRALFMVISITCYALDCVCWFVALSKKLNTSASAVGSVIAWQVMGYIFDETISSKAMLGCALGILAILLVDL